MAQWKLDHLLDLGQLLATATDIVVADRVGLFFLLLENKREEIILSLQKKKREPIKKATKNRLNLECHKNKKKNFKGNTIGLYTSDKSYL